jgi:hypothetical protein
MYGFLSIACQYIALLHVPGKIFDRSTREYWKAQVHHHEGSAQMAPHKL